MQPDIIKRTAASASVIHPLKQEDSLVVATQRASAAPMKGKLRDVAARDAFNSMMEQVLAPDGIKFEADTIGGTQGWWARVPKAHTGVAVMHMHGGWFNFGSARAFRNFVGHIALSAGADAFIPDYRLVPEHPFPAAVEDIKACYRGLTEKGVTKIALSGDSAGGNLALVLLAIATAEAGREGIPPAGAVAFSPVTDLALSGESYATRAEADPYFTKAQVTQLVRSYLADTNSKDPLASPLYGDLSGLPPVRVFVGDDEVLLDDSRRYVEKAITAKVDAKLDIWMGMPHGFVNGIGRLDAASQALSVAGGFLAERLEIRDQTKKREK